jgi:methylenetetrahydrofolate--tRNA-(uracil-5-)-methyltransferase
LFPPFALALAENGKRLRGPAKALARKQALCHRALDDLEQWIGAARMAAE